MPSLGLEPRPYSTAASITDHYAGWAAFFWLYSPKTVPHHRIAAVAKWYRCRIVAGLVMSSSLVPLKTRRVGQRCTLNLSRAEMSSRWCGVVVRRRGASSGVVHVT
ncbi:uncharacterized protein TNCV_4475221 [Trichonephila clavipes]|nr:uncharacterized protein TNCV_4475221 [Trichonephila clavipes]